MQIARHIESVILTLPPWREGPLRARADSGLYCWEVVQTYEKHRCRFIVVARKTPRLVEELKSGALEALSRQPMPMSSANSGTNRKVWGRAVPVHRSAV